MKVDARKAVYLNTKFDYENMNWTKYEQYRPEYPDDLYAIIYEYHASHGGIFERAYDLGSGSGLVAGKLLQRFEHVTVSDPMAEYIQTARSLLLSVVKDSRIAFAQHAAEQPLEADKVDLITAGTCLHWADLVAAADNLQRFLRSNSMGTLAIWMYGANAIVEFADDTALTQKDVLDLQRTYQSIYTTYTRIYDRDVENQKITGPGATINARFDNLSFDPKLWKDVRRIKWINDRANVAEEWPFGESQVRPGEVTILSEQRDFFSKTVDVEWLEQYLRNLAPSIADTLFSEASVDLAELRRVVAERKLKIVWPGILVLATRL